MFGGIDFIAQCTDDLLHFCEFVFILGQTLANSFQSEVNTSKPALLLAMVICSSVFEEGSESLLQFLELLRGAAFECLQLIFGGSGLCCEGSEDFVNFCELVLIMDKLLVLTFSDCLYFFINKNTKSLFQLLDSELKVFAHLLYEHVIVAYLSLLCQKHNFKFLFHDLVLVSQISILCHAPTL